MKEKTKNILRIVLTVLDHILHLFIKKHDDTTNHSDPSSHPETTDRHPELVSGSDPLVSASDHPDSGSEPEEKPTK